MTSENLRCFEGTSGRCWRYRWPDSRDDQVRDGSNHDGLSDTDEPVVVSVIDAGLYAADIPYKMRAIAVERKLAAPDFFLVTLDYRKPEPWVIGNSSGQGVLYVVRELADQVGHKVPRPAPKVADAIERDIGRALEHLHAAGYVHCDVAPNNIFRVGDRWKLGDLESCVGVGEGVIGYPRLGFYRHPGAKRHAPARPEFDCYGLKRTCEWLRGAP